MGRTACTEPQYSYTSTPPMDRTACTEPQYSYTSTAPMGRTACTEPQYSYTSTPPMGRTACTEPQCLYKGDLYLYLYTPTGPFIFVLLCLINPLNAELNPICHLLALLGAHHIFHVSVLRVKDKRTIYGLQLLFKRK